MRISRSSILFFIVISITSLVAEGDMVIRGETMRHDTNENITTAEGGAGLATTDWGSSGALKKLQAKIIRAKMCENAGASDENASKADKSENHKKDSANSLGPDIEWIEAKGEVQVTFPNRTMTANYCKSVGKKINCTGNVVIISGKNRVKGDNGSFDLEKDQYEISTNPGTKHQVEATLYPDAVQQ
ncbi:MAG: hypothetical protein V4482_00090 [Pseudomonadota bacterium]